MPDLIITYSGFDAALKHLRELHCDPSSALELGLEGYEAASRQHLKRIGQVGMEIGLTQFDCGEPALEDARVQVARSSKRYMTGFGAVTVERGQYRRSRSGPADCPLEEGAKRWCPTVRPQWSCGWMG